MEKLSFRVLKAEEIDCRIATVKEKGITLLLYKDARVDQNILDEVVGPMNWSRSHQMIGERLYCTVSIRDEKSGEWVSKQDVGTESNSEKEKGQASDSFKRACFNWGIGRELYTAPFIWISSKNCTITETNQKRFTCYDTFRVSFIGYDANKNINELVIKNAKNNKVVYRLGQASENNIDETEEEPFKKVGSKLTQAQINTLYNELGRTGIGWKDLCKAYCTNVLADMSTEQFVDAMEKLKAKPDKPLDPAKIPPEEVPEGLPWNTPER